MRDIWSFLLQTLTASGVAALLLVLKIMFRDKLSPRWQFAVWGVLAVILLLPAGWGGRYVLLNWPFVVELLRSALTGEYGALAHVTAPIPLAPLSPPKTAAQWLFVVYAAGVLFFLVRYLLSYVRLRLALRQGRAAENGQIHSTAKAYGLSACPAVEVEGLPSAFICGVVKPVLAVPSGVETDEKVILHELLHLKYHDAAWGLVICLFRCLHWCNPLLWYCANLAGNDLESLCDQRVLERLEGEDRRDYGRILLDMADEKYARAPGTSSMANGAKNIRRRIEAIARFKRYPAGMGLVSVCVLLIITAPLAVGVRANVRGGGPAGFAAADLACARTVYCTTYAGAFDTYAKAVLTRRPDYRAMCAPLSEQNALAESCQTSAARRHREWSEGNADIRTASGYQIYNLTPVGENAYAGILVLELSRSPEGSEMDETYVWLAVQSLRAEREGQRWVVTPLEKFGAVQAYGWASMPTSCTQLPAWEYTASEGDFTLKMRWQTQSCVDSNEQTSSWFGSYSTFSTMPRPDGEFTTRFHQSLYAVYTGAPEDKDRYQSIGASCMPLWGEEKAPSLRGPGMDNSSGGSSSGENWGSVGLEGDWDSEIFISGGGSRRDGPVALPSCYAADLYLNKEKTAELTLLPVEGGTTS